MSESDPSDVKPDSQSSDSDAGQPRHADRTPTSGKRAKKQRKPRSWWVDTLQTIGIALVLAILIKTFLVQAFYIPSASMEPTLDVGDRIMVSKLAPGPLQINRGDIVVFVDPGGWLDQAAKPQLTPIATFFTWIGLLPANSGEHLIKRVIGLPGDTVECCSADGKLLVNGTEITEPYIMDRDWYAKTNRPQDTFKITVPEGSVWVMGDNRLNSLDSRYHQGDPGGGTVAIKQIVGVAFLITWPLDRFGILRNPGATFANVPNP